MEKIPPIGQRLSPILAEIEDTLWEHEATLATKPEYTVLGFRAAIKIFASAVLDAAFSKMKLEGKNLAEMEKSATDCGKEIRDFVLKYTGIDSKRLYDNERSSSKQMDS